MSLDTLKALPHYLLPKQALTSFAGFMANIKTPWIKNYLISQFVAKYDVNMLEACEENPLNYACFNDFFIRHLKAERRPIADAGIVSPVDGCISEIGNITQGQILQAKGRYYTVNDFLACDSALCEQFINGRFATLYLSPKDYHRIHMPIEGTLRNMIYVPGKLFSVAPATVGAIPQLFARNERLVVFFDTPVGLMAMVLVGATIVGSISTTWHGEIARSKNKTPFDYTDTAPRTLVQGAEMGYFKLGSTVVLLFANNHSIEWQKGLSAGDTIQFGQALAQINEN